MRGFTLIEVLAALMILALMVAGGVSVFGQARQGALRQQTWAQLHTLAAQISAIQLKTGQLPLDLSRLPNEDAWGDAISYVRSPDGGQFILTSQAGSPLAAEDDITYDSRQN